MDLAYELARSEEGLPTLAQITLEKVDGAVAGLGTAPSLNGMDVAQLAYDAGWHDAKTLSAAVGTCASESLFHPDAFHHNVAVITDIADGTKVSNVETGEPCVIVDASAGKVRLSDGSIETVPLTTSWVTSTDWGMWQINDAAHPDFFPNGSNARALDPVQATDKAFDIYVSAGQSLDPWFGHKNLVYLDDYYVRRAWLAVLNFGGRLSVLAAEARPATVAGRTTPATKTRVPLITLSEFRKIYPAGT